LRDKNSSTSEYLASLSAKYEVDPDRLFSSLVSAAENKEATCGDLSIVQRGETHEKIMFLILTGSEIVAQVSIFKTFLSEHSHPIRNFMGSEKIRRFLSKKASTSGAILIRDLRDGMTGVCLKAKVLEVSKPSTIYTYYGNSSNVANALIADETGTIRLCLWNDQIDSISTGDTIQIENGRTSTFKGQKQLNIGKKGMLTRIDNPYNQAKAAMNA